MTRLTVKQAAQKLDLPPQAIRSWVTQGTCPFGSVIYDKKSKNGRRTYYINGELLKLYMEGKV